MIRTAIKALPVLVVSLCLFGHRAALAAEPANLRLGPLFITPTVDLEGFYTDNLLRTNEDETDTWAAVLTPRVELWVPNGPSDYSLTFEIEDSTYENSSDDDFTDYTTNLDIHQEFNARNAVNVFGEYYDGHEQRGTGFIEGDLSLVTDKPVEYELTTAGSDYTYGSSQSKGRVKLAGKTVNYQYQNYRDFTRYYDRDENTLAGTFYWKVAPRTDALIEARAIENDYDETDPLDPAGDLSSDEINYLLGVEWSATAKSAGHVKLGMYDREYDSGARQDDDGFLWEVGVQYRPRSYATFNLDTRRFNRETNGLGNAINTQEVTVAWKQEWSDRSSTALKLGYSNDDYKGAEREDDNYGVEARYDYAFRRWFDLGAGYRYRDRDSDFEFFSYTENVFFLEAKLSL